MAEPTEPVIPDAVLSLLRCPLTRSPLRLEGGQLVAERPEGAGLRYPIRDGIPQLLESEAMPPEGLESVEAFKAKYADELARPPAGSSRQPGS